MTSGGNGEGIWISQTFDQAGRLATVTSNWVDSQHPASLMSMDSNPVSAFWPAGQLRKAAYGNNLTSTSAYNNRLQPCRINVNSTGSLYSSCTDSLPSGNVQDFTYGYNLGTSNNGSIMSLSATGASGAQTFSRSYTYDPLNRLATMSGPGGSCMGLSWSYDPWGNRTAQTPTRGTCNQSNLGLDSNNRINSPSGFTYDASGNLAYDGSHHYYYDAENRLIQVDGTLGTCSSAAACYVYDADGHRIERTVGATTIDYLYDLDGRVMVEVNSGPTVVADYIYAGGQLIAQYKNSTLNFVHGSHLGSSGILTSVAGVVTDCNAFYPFGEQDTSICASSATTTHKFTGKERDTESNLDNFGARYYSSAMGRFMSPDDPFADQHTGDPQSWNLYSYVRNNTLNSTDPDGQKCKGDNNGNYNGDTCGQDTGTGNLPQIARVNAKAPPALVVFAVNLFNAVDNVANDYFSFFLGGYRPSYMQNTPIGNGFAAKLGAIIGVVGTVFIGPAGEAEEGIRITQAGLEHVLERHAAGGAQTLGKSVFNAGEDIKALIQSAGSAPAQTSGSVLIRTVDAGRTIGVDRATGQATSVYTVITKSSGELISAYPGRP
jgi:RHS repeat-associated protein